MGLKVTVQMGVSDSDGSLVLPFNLPNVMPEASAFWAFALPKMKVVDEWLPVCGRFEQPMLPA